MAAYVEHKTLTGEHCDSVNSVAFSQNGKYLASASSDCSVCIWNVSSGSFLFRIVFESAVNTLLWHPTRQGTLLCGCEDGSVLSMRDFTPVRSVILSEVWHATYVPQEGYNGQHIRLGVKASIACIDIEPQVKLLAIGVGNQVHISQDGSYGEKHLDDINLYRNSFPDSSEDHTATTRLPPPPKVVTSGDIQLIRPRSVHFIGHGKSLIVSYLNHGVV